MTQEQYKILIIEDDITSCIFIKEFLQNKLFLVDCINDGYSGLSQVMRVTYDIILLDIMLPDINGFEVCKQLKENPTSKEIPVIFLTAREDIESKIQGLACGGVDYLQKPIEVRELLARINVQLELLRTKRQLERELKERILAEKQLIEAYEQIEQTVAERTEELRNEITSRKEVEQKLEKQVLLFSLMFDEHSAVMLLINPKDGKIEQANQAAIKFYGYSEDELLQKTIFEINVSTGNQITQSIQETTKRKKLIFEFKHQLANNQTRDVEVHSSPIIFEGKDLLFSIIHDITEKKSAERELDAQTKELERAFLKLSEMSVLNEHQKMKLEETNHMKDKLFSIIAHDLKNPFQNILGFTGLLVENFENYPPKKILRFIKLIRQSSKSAYELLENLLNWSRSQSGRLKIKIQNYNLSDIFYECWHLLHNAALLKEIKLKLAINPRVEVLADKDMLKTIFRNLISNAIKFSHRNNDIIVKAEVVQKGIIKISIIDNGIGMTQDDIDKLFRIDIHHTTLGTAEEAGTGLGLVICKEFVEKMNGEITVESEKNKGSKFSFTLPLT